MAEENNGGTPPTGNEPTAPAWAESLSDEHKAVVHEKGWKEVSDIIGAVPKADAWTASLSDDQRGMLESKGFKELGMLVDSYGNLEKLKGVPPEQLLQIPQKTMEEDPEAWNKYWTKLGRPEKAEDYAFKFPEEAKADENTVKWAQETFHNLGLTKKQGEGFIEKWNEFVVNAEATQKEALKEQAQEAETELKTKWGLAYAKNKQVAETTAKQFGVDIETIDKMASVMGVSKVAQLFHSIGKAMGESNFVSGDVQNQGLMSPEAAQFELKELQHDAEFVRKFADGDREAVNKHKKLVQMAYPGTAS